jgi:hypothetical protein
MIVKVSKFRSAGHSRHIRKHFSLLLASILHELVTNVKSESMKAHMYTVFITCEIIWNNMRLYVCKRRLQNEDRPKLTVLVMSK